ncbi:hypothetical protein DL89DRAFT_127742 [Linderina pennispora]|uniref:Uncharacterized protein n=1 Tax=Linderina pennispora TaxID=61395 RepID=A0A1Y1WDU1_9FUNG|nr:uncharacterized protein DL89DRAFT_127742 [Linderina pennispora]ORX71498.1 hypothetical protein DL89DRAFT_127742 [Linderina pennispora]
MIAQMHECLNIPYLAAVPGVILSTSVNSSTRWSAFSHKWSPDMCLLVDCLRPNHLLVLIQTFVYCYMNDDFVPSLPVRSTVLDAERWQRLQKHVLPAYTRTGAVRFATAVWWKNSANVHTFYRSISHLVERRFRPRGWNRIVPGDAELDQLNTCIVSLRVSMQQIELRLPNLAGTWSDGTVGLVGNLYASQDSGPPDANLIKEQSSLFGPGHWVLEEFSFGETVDTDTWCQRALDLMYQQVKLYMAKRATAAAADASRAAAVSVSFDTTAHTPKQRLAAIRAAYLMLLELSESANEMSLEDLTRAMNKIIAIHEWNAYKSRTYTILQLEGKGVRRGRRRRRQQQQQ